MARIYEDEPTFFGPPSVIQSPAADQVNEGELAEIQKRQKQSHIGISIE